MRAPAAALVLAALAGCAGAPQVPELLAPRDPAPAELQARAYESVRPEEMLLATVSALQDFGFQVTSSDAALGLVVAQRGYRKEFSDYNRDFWRGYGRTMKNFFTLQWHAPAADPLMGPAGFSAAVSVAPAGSGSSVRVSFHHFVRRPTGEPIVVWAEELRSPEPYQRFFALLSAALATTSSRSPVPALPAR